MTPHQLTHVDSLTTQIDTVSARIEAVTRPFPQHVDRFDEVTGIGTVAAEELLAEIGVEVGRFPSPAHLVSWAKFVPIDGPGRILP